MSIEDKRKYHILSFLLGMLPFLISAVSFIARNDWIFYLYGDFNVQQIPFTLYLSKNLSELHFPQFDFNAGSGLDYMEAYSFFNLFSPFTLIYALLPDKWAIYAIPFVMAFRFGISSLGAYIYISRFCKTDEYAVIGGLLYTYSGFQMMSLLTHFSDGHALFPFLLAALEAAVNEKRRGIFGITAALCVLTNYYVFGIEVIFLAVYFLVRLTDKTFRISVKDFLCLGLESVLGVMAAGIVLMPAAIGIVENPRMTEHFRSLREMLLYESPWRYPRILQALFIMPDFPGFTNFFPDYRGEYPYGSRWSSLGIYIPMFGISGAAAFVLAKKKSWQTRLAAACLVIAFVPVLNSIFSVGSSLYYARWLFAPTLIMALMTACALENEPEYFKPGLIINGAAVLLIVIFCVLFPMEKLTLWESGAFYNNIQKWIQILFTIIGLLAAAGLLFKAKRDSSYQRSVLALTVVFVFAFSEITILFGMGDEPYPERIADSYPPSGSYPEIQVTEQGSRIAASGDLKNLPLLWNTGTPYVFNTIVNPYSVRYCDALEITKDEIIDDYPTQCLMSAKTFIAYNRFGGQRDESAQASVQFGTDMFEFSGQKGAYLYFENSNYIPMGFCYEYCISEEEFLSLDSETRERLMLKAMVVNDTSAVSEFLTPIPEEEIHPLDDAEFSEECSKRAEKTAYSYTTDDDSYYAEISLDEPELVFFSVSYDEKFTAYVDGEETELINANFGFQAVPVPAGTHKIQVKYHSPWRDMGLAATVIGLSGLAVYTVICCILNRKRKN